MAPVTVKTNSTVSASSGSTGWSAESIYEVSGDLYAVVQASDSKLHMMRSTDDGGSWSELDGSDAPSVTNASYPWSSTRSSTGIKVVYFSAANTLRVRTFTISSGEWESQDDQTADATTAAANYRPVRIGMSEDLSTTTALACTDSADDADTRSVSRTTGAWAGGTFNLTSDDCSTVLDCRSADAAPEFYLLYDIAAADLSRRTRFLVSSTSDLDTDVATSSASHASSVYVPYDASGTPRYTVAYIDADNSINEVDSEVYTNSNRDTQRQVTSSTAYAGGKLSTCEYDGDRYVFASNAAGTSIDYWVFNGSAWVSGGNVATGTGLHLSQALPVEGKGIIVSYQNGSDVMVSWAVDGPEEEISAFTPTLIKANAVVAEGSGATGWSAKSLVYIPGLRPVASAVTGGPAGSSQLNGGVGSNSACAQSFTPSSTGACLSVSFIMYTSGSPADNIYVTINADAAGVPSTTILATSASVSAASIGSGTLNFRWQEFTFPSPPTLMHNTKYWLVIERSGARDTSNRVNIYINNSSADAYPGHGSSSRTTSSWGAENSTNDFIFTAAMEAAPSLYVVAQSKGDSPELHVLESTDSGAIWNECDSTNAPSVSNASYAWSAVRDEAGAGIYTARFTGTTTIRGRVFATDSNKWASIDQSDLDATTNANSTSPVRIATFGGTTLINHTLANDIADIGYARRQGGTWTSSTVLGATSGERSVVIETIASSAFYQQFWQNAQDDDFEVRSYWYSEGSGAVLDIDATAATSEASHAPATYEPYLVTGTTTVTAAYIDANDTINERECSLDVTSASIGLGTQRQVTASTAYAGGQLSTCKYGGKRYVFAAKADGTGIDYWIDEGSGWGEVHNLVTEGPDTRLSQALPIEGSGIYIVYNRDGDVYGGWAVTGSGEVESTALPRGYAFLLE